jgi:hypothetical protein
MNSRRIIELKVSTKSDKTPGVSGIFHIDADEKDIVGSDYTFNEAAGLMKKVLTAQKFPVWARIFIDFDASYRVYTKKVLINGVYWLPERIIEDVNIKSLGSRISFQRELQFDSYSINLKTEDISPDLENNKNGKEEVIFRRDPILESRVFSTMEDSAKLTKEEENQILSSVENKFLQMESYREKMSLEQKGRKIAEIAKGFGSNLLLYNRVEGLRLFYEIGFAGLFTKNSLLNIKGGYGINDKRWKGNISYKKYVGKNRKLLLSAGMYDDLYYNESESLIPTVLNTYTSLLFKLDYRDYYYAEGFTVGLKYEITSDLKFSLSFTSQEEEKAENQTEFGLFNHSSSFRLNPGIQPGTYRGIKSSLEFRSYNKSFNITAEYSDDNYLKSDFNYKSILSELNCILEPDYSSKFTLTLLAGLSSGILPPQKWFDFGGKTIMNYYHRLRGVGYKAFTGDRMVKGLLEYSFCHGDVWDSVQNRSWWEYAFRMTKFTLWTGHAYSNLSDKNLEYANGRNIPALTANDIYREYGFSIGDRFNIIRFDFITNNASNNTVLFSINLWR